MQTITKLIAFCFFALIIYIALACQPRVARSEEPINAPEPAVTPKPAKGPITIAAVGDIMMGSPFPNDTRMPPNDGADLLKDVTPILSAADIAFGNLEGPIVDGGTSAKCRPGSTQCFAFRVPTRYGKYLKAAGFDVMSVANNQWCQNSRCRIQRINGGIDTQIGNLTAQYRSRIQVSKSRCWCRIR